MRWPVDTAYPHAPAIRVVIDWSNRRARRRLLAQIMADADRLLELTRQAQEGLPAGDGVSLKAGVSKDRMVSVHDTQMRHRQRPGPAVLTPVGQLRRPG